MDLTHETLLSVRPLTAIGENGVSVLVDRETPNWLATDAIGAALLDRFDGRQTLGGIVSDYAAENGFEWSKAWQHVETIARDALRQGILGPNGANGTGPNVEQASQTQVRHFLKRSVPHCPWKPSSCFSAGPRRARRRRA